MTADDLLEELREVAGRAADGAELEPEAIARFGKAFLKLDLACIEGRPPNGWSRSKLSKSSS